jgi:hypothetical protein
MCFSKVSVRLKKKVRNKGKAKEKVLEWGKEKVRRTKAKIWSLTNKWEVYKAKKKKMTVTTILVTMVTTWTKISKVKPKKKRGTKEKKKKAMKKNK